MRWWAILMGLVLAGLAWAAGDAPYAGQQARDVKALSAAQVQGYLAGRGMGLAKAAELNGYPGPKHVLELAQPLGLSAAQRARTQALFAAMQAEASAVGAQIIDQERRLDKAFAQGSLDAEQLRAATAALADLQGRLRYIHLHAHLVQKPVLDAEQIRRYQQLRGYGAGHDGHHHHGH